MMPLVWSIENMVSITLQGVLQMPVDRIVFRSNLESVLLCVLSRFTMSFVLTICTNNDKCCSLQRLYMVKPCPKEMKCDVEVSTELTYLF